MLQLLMPIVLQQSEACAAQLESSPSSLQLEKAYVQQWWPTSPKVNKYNCVYISVHVKKKKKILLSIRKDLPEPYPTWGNDIPLL